MSRSLDILNGISEWIRESVGPDAENRGQNDTGEEADESDETDDEDDGYDSPVCCSAAGNTDLTVLDE